MRIDFPILQSGLKFLFGFFYLLLFAAICFGQAAAPNAVPQLRPGVPVESSFGSGETQTFRLHLEINQIAAVVLNQKGINAGIALDNAAGGKRLLEVAISDGGYGYERALVASGSAPQDILVRVFPVQNEKATGGKFSISLAELKTANEKDKLRIESQTTLLNAARMISDIRSESKRQGIFLLDGFRKSVRESGDQILEATALRLLQTGFKISGEPDKSIEYGKSALTLLAGNENRYFRLTVNELIGAALVETGEPNRSIEILNECLAETETFGDESLRIKVLLDLRAAYQYLNDLTKSLELAGQGLKISRSIGDRKNQIYSLSALGSIYINRGDPFEVIKILNEALAIGEASGIKPAEVYQIIYSNISTAYIEMGQMQKSLEYDQKALEMTRQTGNKLDEADCLINLSKTYWRLGQNTRSMNYTQQAMGILSKLNFKTASRTNLDLQGGIFLGLNEFEKAKEVYIEALKLAQQDNPPDLIRVKNSYYNLGFIEQNLGHLEIALDYYLKAARQAEEMKLQNSAVSYLKSASAVYILLGQSTKADELATKVLKMSRDFGDRDSESDALYTLARVRRAQKDLPAALKLIENALKIVESTRSELIGQDNRTGYLSMVHDKYDFYISLLVEMRNQPSNQAFGALAFAASERARARGLLDLLAESNTDISAGINPQLKERERGIYAKLSALQTQLIQIRSAEKQDEKRIANLQNDIETADNDREKLESEIKQTNPRYAALKYPATVDLKQIQAMLDEQTVLLEYQIGADASYLFAVGKNEFQIIELPDEKILRTLINTLHKSISTPARTGLSNYLLTGRTLYGTLVAPVENLLKTKKKIIIAADGALHYLPFEALLRNDTQTSLDKLPYLVLDFEISYTPSASVLANLKSVDKAVKPAKSFLAFAAPDYGVKSARQKLDTQETRSVFDENRVWNLTDLQFAKAEATRIAKLFPAGQSTVLTGAEATEERVKENDFLSQYRYLHFAVHGLIDEEQPQFSSLVLSLPKPAEQSKIQNLKPKIEEDGLLQTPEIFNLRLRADLVTLSACETGLGQEMRGEGIVGLTRAFFYAGTPSVLVSLWKVDDASTAELMTLFYENLLKNGERDKSAALRESQLKMIGGNRYAHPYYWASFILQGKTISSY